MDPATIFCPNLACPARGQIGQGNIVSLSRLNHRLPRCETHPEIVEGTAQFHHQITDAFFPQADAVFHDATTLDTAIDMLDP